jgi:hypothetical protein
MESGARYIAESEGCSVTQLCHILAVEAIADKSEYTP